ncbi:hypothetical protein QFX17_03015 [Lactobacillus helveticus]|uniref:hypothetical protein n=1 Tax=Lactobacillus helveticus TaxID=1587 RepID=UPI001A0BD305|nr:hypothetical protein [Lactobacillus helveticus]MDN6778508.1 hypothetical protein [Lactobacillus sp.]MCO0806770.1 hypothetical protein [Lactobacillus helveticus]MDH5817260.1 hypothetical protein [Lactobacillus helveticus]NRO03608.1 hypothetical protein [Lactobacillus helveticus]NRO37997.1 hypothetical protein [Lactobacillus helveticus]
MIILKIIPPNYFIVIGVDGYNSIADNNSYFDNYYLPKYVEKITLISMLLMSWYSVEIAFHADDKESELYKYSDKEFTAEDVDILIKLISGSMHHKGYIHFLFKDDEGEEFLMYIYGDSTIGFCNMTEKTKKYVEAQVNKQGLSLWLDESE